jgi:two-component system response regulator FlrC
MHHVPVQFDAGAVRALLAHPWPGNVRELDNAMQRALILQGGVVVSAAHLRLEPVASSANFGEPPPAAQPKPSEDSDEQASGLNGDLRLREFELIVNMLKDTRGSKATAAERLGISPRTLRYKLARMRESGLDVEAALQA